MVRRLRSRALSNSGDRDRDGGLEAPWAGGERRWERPPWNHPILAPRGAAIRCLTRLRVFSTVPDVPPRRQFRALALVLLLLSGCGPVLYLREVSTRAAAALARARADGAEQYAPYELVKATLYYDKAREDAGHADYQHAIEWGRRSQDCSNRASALAKSAQSQHGADVVRRNKTCGEL
jgi:hypothetical protein